MKKIIIFSVAALLVACNGNTRKQTTSEADVTTTTEVQENIDPEHNAHNSLDYEGTYKGQTPSASGEGIDVTITLADSTYTKEIVYVGKSEKPLKSEGTYTWSENGSTITLTAEDEPNQYFVGENTLTQLDIEGNKITGDLADMYVLKK